MTALHTWILLLARIQTLVSRITYTTWFDPITFHSDDGQTVRVSVPNELFAAWLERRYRDVVQEALRQIGRPESRVLYVPETL